MILRCRLWIPACPRTHRPPAFPGPEERWTVGAGAVPLGRVLFPRRLSAAVWVTTAAGNAPRNASDDSGRSHGN